MQRSALAGNREFRLLWVSGLLASLGSQLSSIALPLLVLRQTGSAIQAGAIGTVSVGVLLFSMLPGGVVADRMERRRLMRVCDVGSLLVSAALAVAVMNGRSPLLLVLGVAAAGALINSFYGPAALGLLRAIVPTESLGAATSRMQARNAAARLVGPLVGGALFAWHPAAPFIGETVGLLLSTSCLAFMRTRSAPAAKAKSAFGKEELTAGIGFIWQQPYLRTVLLVFGLGMNFAFSAVMFTALAVASHGGRSGLGGGAIASMTAFGALTGAVLAPRLRPQDRAGALISGTCWLCAAAAAAMAVSQNTLLMGGLTALAVATSSVAGIGFLSSLLIATPEDRVGRVQSAAGFLSSIVQPAGPLVGGALLGLWGAVPTFGALGAVFVLCAAVVTWAPAARRGPAAAAPTATPTADHPPVPSAPVLEI